jgi:RHS repeat-associated protein
MRLRVAIAGNVVVEEESDALQAALLGDDDGDGRVTHKDARARSGLERRRALRAAAHGLLTDNDGDGRRYLHHHHPGSVVAVSDADGAVVERFSYAPHGEVRFSSAVQTRAAAFTGRHADESGLIDLGVRFLLPREGRFLTPDPTFRLVGASSFDKLPEAFASTSVSGNDPASFVDLEGRFPWKRAAVCTAVVVGLGALVTAGMLTGVLPVLAAGFVATVAAAFVAHTVASIVGGVVGGVVGALGEAYNQYTRLKIEYTSLGKPVPLSAVLSAVATVAVRFALGAFSGFMSYGLTAVEGVASDIVTNAQIRKKISPRAGVAARLALAVAGGGTTTLVTSGLSAGASAFNGTRALTTVAVNAAQNAGAGALASGAAEATFFEFADGDPPPLRKQRAMSSTGRDLDGGGDDSATAKRPKKQKTRRFAKVKKTTGAHPFLGHGSPL